MRVAKVPTPLRANVTDSYVFAVTDGEGKTRNAYLHVTPNGKVFVDTSGMKGKTKARGGDLIYQTALTYAHNNGLQFRPDPDSVTDIGRSLR